MIPKTVAKISSVRGRIALGDEDGSGVTYITANNGVLTASTSDCSQ